MKMLKAGSRNLVLLLALLLLRSAMAADVQTAAVTNKHSLWKITGQHASVYLLGSVHILRPQDYPLAAPIERAFSNAAVVVFETDVSKLEGMEAQGKLLKKAMLPAGETLKTQLSPETYSRFTKVAEEAGLPLFALQKLKPVVAAVSLLGLQMQKLGFDAQSGIDLHFYRLACEQKKTIIPLETVDFQIDLITGFSMEEGEAMVKSTLEDIENLKKVLGDMIKAWQTGDTAGLEKLLNTLGDESPAVYKRAVTDRSRSWVPKVEELLGGNKDAVVIVGAGHLVGKDNLVDLLQKRGLKVVQE